MAFSIPSFFACKLILEGGLKYHILRSDYLELISNDDIESDNGNCTRTKKLREADPEVILEGANC